MEQKSLSLFEEFTKSAQKYAFNTAVISHSSGIIQKLSYSQLFGYSIRIGNFLLNHGVTSSEKIAILLENIPEWPAAFMAIQYIGAIAVPLDIKASPQEIELVIKHSEAKIVICSEKTISLVSGFASVHKEIKVLIVGSAEFTAQLNTVSKEPLPELTLPSPDKTCAIFYTSGTVTNPKGVLLSHTNLIADVRAIYSLNLSNEKDVFISLLPLHHTYPFTGTFLVPLLEGAAISYPASINPEDVLSCIRDTEVTVLAAVPQLFSLFQSRIKNEMKRMPFISRVLTNILIEIFALIRSISGLNLNKYLLGKLHSRFGKSLRFLISGGARLDPEITLNFMKWGFTILEGYGLTETSPIITLMTPKKVKPGSVGKPLPGVIVNIENKGEDGIGEINACGKNVMLGYFKMPEETKKVLQNGCFFTGDLGYFDNEGYLFLTGRKDEIIVLNTGKKINPEELERQYGACPFIKEICILSVESKEGEGTHKKLMALVVPDEDYFRARGMLNIEEKIRWEMENISNRMGTARHLQGVIFTTQKLPRTSLGKIMRHKIDVSVLKTSDFSSTRNLPPDRDEEELLSLEINRKILKTASEKLKREVHLKDHLELDLGLDSLGRIELFLDIQPLLNIDVPDTVILELFYCNTIKELLLKLKPLLGNVTGDIKEKEFVWSEALKEQPARGTLKRIALFPSFAYRVVNVLFQLGFIAIFRVLFLMRVRNRSAMPYNGPCIIVPNHTSYFDAFIVFAALPFKSAINTYFIGFKKYFYFPVIRHMIKVAKLLPLDISLDVVEVMKTCSYLLKHDKIICYFPEGERSIDGKVMRFKKGIGILAKELNIPIMPVHIDGAYRSWSRRMRVPKLARLTVTFGNLTTYSQLFPTSQAVDYEEVAEKLRQKLVEIEKR